MLFVKPRNFLSAARSRYNLVGFLMTSYLYAARSRFTLLQSHWQRHNHNVTGRTIKRS